MDVLGISAFYHDSAAALVRDGRVLAAAQQERFSRVKHDKNYPRDAIEFCLRDADVDLRSIDRVVFFERPERKLRRQIETQLAVAPAGFRQFREVLRSWSDGSLDQRRRLLEELAVDEPDVDWADRLDFCEHHVSHAAAAFLPSPFAEASVLTVDAVGESATTSAGVGRGHRVELTKELHFPHSLGMLYSAFTSHLGFKVNSGEYKLMGLAPYGRPIHTQQILDELIDVKSDGSFRLNMDYFGYCTGLEMTNERFVRTFGGRARGADDPIEQLHMDLAASVQEVTETVMLRLARSLHAENGIPRLCLGGGVALNCVANGRILREGPFDDIWIQPAAGDAGSALGAALWACSELGNRETDPAGGDSMRGSLLGPAFGQADVERRLDAVGARYTVMSRELVLDRTAAAIDAGLVVGWFQGRMEFGPRALGSRSILADARKPAMQRTLNLKIKYRESFRPFAPAVLAEDASRWFDLDRPSPYMLLVAQVADRHRLDGHLDEVGEDGSGEVRGLRALDEIRSTVPAVTHVDGSARVQTVSERDHPRFHALLRRFRDRTGCPVVVNTSFNVRGEPIVCTPEDAFRCFMGTEMDVLVIENCLLVKDRQDPERRLDYQGRFERD